MNLSVHVGRRRVSVLAIALIGGSITGYFIGITAPMPAKSEAVQTPIGQMDAPNEKSDILPATRYSDMSKSRKSPNDTFQTLLATIKQTQDRPFTKIKTSKTERARALSMRQRRRAFAGAPPTVPHPIDQLTSRGCLACHGKGVRNSSLRISKMPHKFYANCTQCHVEQRARYVAKLGRIENSFAGMAEQRGQRAFAAAPPTVPHSLQLRSDCLSCHGRTATAGIKTTHPWRTNCLQCHATYPERNRKAPTKPHFLPPLSVSDERK